MHQNETTSSKKVENEQLCFKFLKLCTLIRKLPINFLHPYIWDTQIKGYKTFFIQLDSGTNTNLIGLKMAYQLIVSNLINFICPNLQGLLTDVKNK